jgi:hypothetical protein
MTAVTIDDATVSLDHARRLLFSGHSARMSHMKGMYYIRLFLAFCFIFWKSQNQMSSLHALSVSLFAVVSFSAEFSEH